MQIRCEGQSDTDYLRQAFSWLARIGAAPKFGSRPISWYQMHACAALRFLETGKARGLKVRCKFGMIQAKPTIGKWFDVVSARELFNIADIACRS